MRACETDAEFRREYDERMEREAAIEAEWFARELEREKQIDRFDDVRVDFIGCEEIIEPEIHSVVIDDDIPF